MIWQNILLKGAEEIDLVVTPKQLQQFEVLLDELLKWNQKINLTAITDFEDIAVKHFIDSMTLFKVIDDEGTLLDVGSGAGFPAIPLKIMKPELQIVSVDAIGKKIMFQKHIARVLALKEFTPIHERVEKLYKNYTEHFNWIVSRAFASIEEFVELVDKLLAGNGKIIAMKGRDINSEIENFRIKESANKFQIQEINFHLPVSDDERNFIIFKQAVHV
ncbi:MAG: 16S rRNA (guanine(527)-N(7))-methyltransferase RsmG [Desulfuromonadales bacterium]|nr:16S rRNA (guanine(527)-N(7))-methyltransferase RsmG [Desulfuromonadales bacterium]